MDPIVLQALQKWPNVPAVYGWLSLNEKGCWRFHPQGDYNENPSGESINNSQITAFINRNYAVDGQKQWDFQNGPQRVYITLMVAPYILFLDNLNKGLRTHNQLAIHKIKQWYLDKQGRLFAQTDLGGAMIGGRDLNNLLTDASIEQAAFNGSHLLQLYDGAVLELSIKHFEPISANTNLQQSTT